MTGGPVIGDAVIGDAIIGIVGLGTMGLGIAQVFAEAGHTVILTDREPGARDTARARIGAALQARVAAGKTPAAARDAALDRIVVAPDAGGLAGAGLAIEAVAEQLAAKHAVLAALEAAMAPDAVLATNTSSLAVAALAAPLARPGRLVGLHFFNPAPAMRLVELVAHPGSAAAALARARALTEGAGKTVIACPDRPGFIVNRCARPFYGEALALAEEGRDPAAIDAAMRAAGYRIGPFALIDLIGVDVHLAATAGIAAAMGLHPRYHVFDRLRAQAAGADLGRKAARGFVWPDAPAEAPADAGAIALRIEAVLANEAAWLLSEGGVTAEGIDAAMVLGLNFPRGPLAGLRAHGLARILDVLAGLEARAPAHLRGRYVPPRALSEAA